MAKPLYIASIASSLALLWSYHVLGQGTEQQKAAQLWEQAIAAKGGRERLSGVRNIVISSSAQYTSHTGNKSHVATEALIVFPDKLWTWEDYRPDVFGLIVTMYNGASHEKYVLTPAEPDGPIEPISPNEHPLSRMYGLVSVLPEVNGLKPIPLRTSLGVVGNQPVDIVETVLDGERIDFALDRKSHLPVRVSYYSASTNKTFVTEE